MALYFFDISDGIDVHDETGTELPGIEAARAHAIGRATEYVSKLDGEGRGGYIVVTIRDATSILLTLRLVCHIETSGVSAIEYLQSVRERKAGSH